MDLDTILSAVQSWPPEKRLQLIECLRDGLEEDALTESQIQDLQRRLDAYRDNPKAGSPWEEVKARLQGNRR